MALTKNHEEHSIVKEFKTSFSLRKMNTISDWRIGFSVGKDTKDEFVGHICLAQSFVQNNNITQWIMQDIDIKCTNWKNPCVDIAVECNEIDITVNDPYEPYI